MANVYTTLADLVKLNDLNARDLGVSDLLNDAPVLKVLHATTASNGTMHNYIKTTTAPVVGFRAVNTGRFNAATGYTEVTITLTNLDCSSVTDVAIADNYRGGPDAFLAREAQQHIQSGLFSFESQIFYGTANDAAGFAGLATSYAALATAMVVNAAGSTATTGSSVWLFRSTPDETGVTAVIGRDGQISVGQTVTTLKAADADATKTFPAYLTPINAYCGLQIGSAYSVARIANLTADSGKGLTDALISKAIALFPASKQPTHICMNRRSLQQLQASRTATNPMGTPAPFPADAFGIPIVVTDSILSTEALLT